MLQVLDRVTAESLGRLNRNAVRDPELIGALFARLARDRIRLSGGINRKNEPRSAVVTAISEGRLVLRLDNFDASPTPQIYFNFKIDDDRYLFAAVRHGETKGRDVTVDLPSTVFRVERRDLFRSAGDEDENERPRRVAIRDARGRTLAGRVTDSSAYGLGVEIADDAPFESSGSLVVTFRDGANAGTEVPARVCHSGQSELSEGWLKIGLALGAAPAADPIRIDRRDRILERAAVQRARDRLAMWRGALRTVPARLVRRFALREESLQRVSVVEYPNDKGEPIRAIVNGVGDPVGAPAIVIPPAWGRTKETLLPLAVTILETFRRAGQAVNVVRFDGTHRRGESYKDPEVDIPGQEYLNFTFSQAVRDIHSTLDWLYAKGRAPSTTVLVTFSLAAVEGRRAVAQDLAGRIGGWVSVVGMVDLQSALRTISGGVDFAYGLAGGVRFGHHELVGVVSDMDRTGLDAIRNRMVFLEEARQDMSRISVPTTWIHGRHDAWMDLDRVQTAMSCGNTANRKLIEVPTGHQLRTSSEALQTFQLIAEEVSEMALGYRLKGSVPRLERIDAGRRAERARLPRRRHDLRSFWTDYLLGRDRKVGIELMTATAAYKNFMEDQIRLLRLSDGERVADLGSGTGDFVVSLASQPDPPRGIEVDQVDYVAAALERSTDRLARMDVEDRVRVRPIVADLNVPDRLRSELEEARYDAVLSSLVISYLTDPGAFLEEAYRMLKPGGRLILSTLKRDADISRIFLDGMSELAPSPERHDLGEDVAQSFDSLARSFFNDASKILDFEEEGTFRFWDDQELLEAVRAAGFADAQSRAGLGDPPQAVIVSAVKP